MRREQRREILAADVLHRQERLAVGLADVVDAADVGMRDLPRDADLAAKARQPVGDRRTSVGGRNFSATDWPSEQILGAIDLAHPASPDEPEDR